MNPSSNLIRNSNNETNFPHKLSLNNAYVSQIRQAFANSSSAIITFSKFQLSKMIQSRGFLTDITGITGITSGLDDFVNFPFKFLIS